MPSSQYAQFVRVCQLTEMVSTSTAWIICRRIGVQSGVGDISKAYNMGRKKQPQNVT